MQITDIKGVGIKTLERLNNLGITDISDLYNHYPVYYENRTRRMYIKDIVDDKPYFLILKIISKPYFAGSPGKNISYIYATDGYNKIKLLWFNDKFSIIKLINGNFYKFYTKVNKEKFPEAINPLFCNMDQEKIGSIYPVYPLTKGMKNDLLRKLIKESLAYYDPKDNFYPDKIIKKYKVLNRKDALSIVHFPKTISELNLAKESLKIEDFLSELYLTKILCSKKDKSVPFSTEKVDLIMKALPFELTKDQARAVNDILDDFKKDVAMNRILIGDVGSGKTIVAIITMIVAALNGIQVCLMAPTEVLARQHFENYKDLFNSFNLHSELLVGSIKASEKKIIRENILSLKTHIIVGTHTLIQDGTIFKNLRYIVNDEQHRFGVLQRRKISDKGNNPHFLSLSATPIPRTLLLQLRNIVDISLIKELPKGRKKVETKIINIENEKSLFKFLKMQLLEKRQIYIVTDSIDRKDDKYSLKDLFEKYKKVFSEFNTSYLHGKLKPQEKERVMQNFNDGNIDILVATTVIEVGIDVKNANVMVIYNAHNFGLAQLHQLRGRVGRGGRQSYCFVITDRYSQKLEIIRDNHSGFVIANHDKEIRGTGQILSKKQHGKSGDLTSFLNLSKKEIEKSFDILYYMTKNNIKASNHSSLLEEYEENGEIILN